MSLFAIYFRALRFLAPVKNRVLLISAANVVLAFVTIAEPILFGRIIDSISAKQGLAFNLWLWASLATFNIVAYVLIARGSDRLAHERRAGVLVESFERVISMPLAWHHQRGTSHVLHTLLRAVEALFGLWLEFMRQHLTTAVALVLLIPAAISLDLRLSAVLVLLGVAYVAIGRLVMRKTKQGQASVEGHYHRVFSLVSDSVSNVTVLQSYNRIAEETRALKGFTRDLIAAQRPVLDWWALASAMHRLASGISMMAVLVIGAYLVTYGSLRVGDIVAFTGFAALLISRLDQISAFVNQVSDARARLDDFFRLEDSFCVAEEPEGTRDLTNVTGHVRFENVSFAFPNSGHGVHDATFEVSAGETVAIVGPTGAGKTTLIKILSGVHQADAGIVKVEGKEVRIGNPRRAMELGLETIYQYNSMVPTMTIARNVFIGREPLRWSIGSFGMMDQAKMRAESVRAIADVDLHVRSPDALVGELSGGQRQGVAIARAMHFKSKVMILDEPTNHLSVKETKKVIGFVRGLKGQGVTGIFISHNMHHVFECCDRVVAMARGEIVLDKRIEETSIDEVSTVL